MGRYAIIYLVGVLIVATGCQQTKMSKAPVKPQAKASNNNTQTRWTPPPTPLPEPEPTPGQGEVPVTVVEPEVVTPPPAVQTCEDTGTCGTQVVKPPRYVCDEGQACEGIKPVAGVCGPRDIKGEKVLTEVDVLFVVDTSLSMRAGVKTGAKEMPAEIVQIANKMKNFIDQLNEDTDYNISVVLGHGNTQWSGKLFKNSTGNDRYVFKFKDYMKAAQNKGLQGADARQWVANQIAAGLQAKMKSVPNEKGGAQGEALLLSLYKVARTAAKTPEDERKALGMFRKDAVLSVILLSDEQDVCYDYANGPEQYRNEQRKPDKDKSGNPVADKYETDFFEKTCKTAYNGQLLTPNLVHQTLVSLKGNESKLFIAGIVYKDNNTPPGVEDENEMGHGILELVQLNNKGPIIDLAKVDRSNENFFDEEMKFLGNLTQKALNYISLLTCAPAIHANAVDLNTMSVDILSSTGSVLACFGPQCDQSSGDVNSRIKKYDGRKAFLEAVINEVTLNKILQGDTAPKFQFRFDTRPDYDVETGEHVQF